MKRQRVLAALLALSLCLGPLPGRAAAAPAEAPVFADVDAGSPFAPAIAWAAEQGVAKGTGDGSVFSPGETCTRGQIVTFLWRAAGSPEPRTMEAEYMDVTEPGAYNYKAIQWAAEMDMEYAGTFRPGETCSRASAVYFLWKAFGSPKAAERAGFADVPDEPEDGGQWYWPDLPDAVDWAAEQGIAKGAGDGSAFYPGELCTRGQIVTFLYRAYVK